MSRAEETTRAGPAETLVLFTSRGRFASRRNGWTPHNWLNFMRCHGQASAIRLARSFDVHALRHQHRLPAPSDPHWTLETLGIVPEAQGRGPGTRLLVPGLVRADWDALSSQLTMAGAIASGFYPRLGFEVEHDALPWSGPTSWACVERRTSPTLRP